MTLEIKNGSFTYDTGDMVFQNITLKLHEGAVLAVLGPNGSGKTTLLKSLVGLLRLTSGDLLLDGIEISSDRLRTRHFGYVPQITEKPAPYSAFQMVLLGRSRFIGTFGRPADSDFRSAEEAIIRTGIRSLSERLFSSLSGGERQLVLIARALATEARILVFDEPTSALDLVNQNRTLHLLKRLSREEGYMVIFSTHNPSHALHISEKTLLLDKYGCYLFGDTSAVVTEQNLETVFGVETKIIEVPRNNGNRVWGVVPIIAEPKHYVS